MEAASVPDVVREGAPDNSEADLQLLSSQVRISHWINTALTHMVSPTGIPTADTSPSAISPSSSMSTEAAVERLYVRVKAHERSVEAAAEDDIRLSLSRLPRATMELEQMVAETERVSSELQRLTDIVTPSSAGPSDGARNGLEAGADRAESAKVTESPAVAAPSSQQREKRMRELNELKGLYDKLKRCADTLERATRLEEQLRRVDQGIRDFQERGKSSQFTSVLELAKSLETVQHDFTELRQIEPHFGERHKAAMEQYEGFVELALEEACLTHLQEHDVHHAKTLFHALTAIGRADAVLTTYVQRAAQHCTAELEKAFQTSSTGESAEKSASPAMAAEDALTLLESTLLPHLLSAVDAEAAFLFQLSTSADSIDASPSPTSAKDGADKRAGASDSVSVGKAREVFKSLLVHVSAKCEFALKPLLVSPSTTNDQRIRLYETVQHSITTRLHTSPATALDDSNLTASTTTPQPLQQQQQQQQLTAQILSAMVAVFHQADVLAVFCTNLDADAVVVAAAAASTTAATRQASSLWDRLWQSVVSLDALAAWVEKVTLAQVLRYFPDQVLPVCVSKWQAAFTTLLAPVLLEASSVTAAGDGTPRPSSVDHDILQGTLLAQLVFVEKELKPRLERVKQHLEDQLRAPTMRLRYPAGAVVASSALAEKLWDPLLLALNSRTEACQRAVQTMLLQSVFQKTEAYTSLPSWRVTIPAAASSSVGETPAATTDFLASHAVASAPLRELGEAIMELPLALESLSSLDVLRHTQAPPPQLLDKTARSALEGQNGAQGSPGAGLNMAEAVEELASFWLDGLVQSAVQDFLENKFGCVRISLHPEQDPATLTPDQKVKGLQGISEALQQLQADLEYLQNVLSAVSEEPFTALAGALDALQSKIPATEVQSFTVSDVVPVSRAHG